MEDLQALLLRLRILMTYNMFAVCELLKRKKKTKIFHSDELLKFEKKNIKRMKIVFKVK